MTDEELIVKLENDMEQNCKDFMDDILSYEEFHSVQSKCMNQINELKERMHNERKTI